MIIDVHAHPVEETLHDIENARNMLIRMDETGIQQVLLAGAIVPFGPDPSEEAVKRINISTFAISERFADRFFGYCYLNAKHRSKFLEEELTRCMATGRCVGIKLWVSVNAADKKIYPIMELAEKYTLPVLIHAWYKTIGKVMEESTPEDVAKLASAYPRVSILMAHLTACGIRGMLDIKRYQNVSVDTSGSQPYAGILEKAVEILGSKRILFGTDMPNRDPAVQLSRVIDASMTTGAKEDILFRNANQFFPHGMLEEKRTKKEQLSAYVMQPDVIEVYDMHVHAMNWPFAENYDYYHENSPHSDMPSILNGQQLSIRSYSSPFDAFLQTIPYAANRRLREHIDDMSSYCCVPVINPLIADAEEQAAFYLEKSPCISIFPSYHGFSLDHPKLRSLCAYMESWKKVELDGSAGNRPILMIQMRLEDERNQNQILMLQRLSLEDISVLANIFTNLPIIVLGLYSQEIQTLLEQCPVVYADISFAESFDTISDLCSKVSYNQLLFGSNVPLFSRSAALRKIFLSSIPKNWKEAILSKNMLRLLRSR